MKDYKEMTESVLQQAKVRSAHQKHRRRMATGLIAASLCLAVLIAAVGFGVGWNPADATQPTISLQNPTTVPATQPTEMESTQPAQPSENPEGLRIVFLSTSNGVEKETPLEVGIKTPIDYVVYVRNLSGLDDEQRKETEKEWQEFEKTMQSSEGGVGGYTSTSYAYGDMIIGTYMKGFIGIKSDKAKILDISVDTVNEGVGNHGACLGPDDFGVSWFLNPKVLMDNPSTPLSSIRDSLVVTVEYQDGTSEIIIIDISINDDGQVFATLAADPLSA